MLDAHNRRLLQSKKLPCSDALGINKDEDTDYEDDDLHDDDQDNDGHVDVDELEYQEDGEDEVHSDMIDPVQDETDPIVDGYECGDNFEKEEELPGHDAEEEEFLDKTKKQD